MPSPPRRGRDSSPRNLHAGASRRDVLRGAAAAAGALTIEACHGGPGPVSAGSAAPGAAGVPAPGPRIPGALEVKGTRFYKDDKPFFVSGFNYWSPMPAITRDGDAGWDRARRDLDGMQALGVNLLRIMGATEGPDTEPLRIVPTLQPALGQYDPKAAAALARFVSELERRGMHAIITLNNFWPWSGGMGQYMSWTGSGPIPYPPPQPRGDWNHYQNWVALFYSNPRAVEAFNNLIRFLVPPLKASPAVIWQLCNEPRGMNNVKAFNDWIGPTAGLIKALAPSQLVTTGTEGLTGSPTYAGMDPVRNHRSPNIDFMTFHMWAENWGWVNKDRLDKGLPKALELARKYIDKHTDLAAQLGKPLLLEEFGFPRDGGSFVPGSPTTLRDKYYDAVYGMVHNAIGTTPMAGVLPWAWAGETKPPRPGEYWRVGDPFTGDPPHEQQGWYSVYTDDTTTKLIQSWSARLATIGAAAPAAAGSV